MITFSSTPPTPEATAVTADATGHPDGPSINARTMSTGDLAESTEVDLDRFLRNVERRALRMAELGCGQRDAAFDLVQDAMLAFVRRYAERPPAEWAPLFHRVLDNRLTDWHRRQNVRGRWMFSFFHDDDDGDPLESVVDEAEPGPLGRLAGDQAGAVLDTALRALPLRQRQAFLLRVWEGLDVGATAIAMRCSEGSVKTHLSRALSRLRDRLGEFQ